MLNLIVATIASVASIASTAEPPQATAGLGNAAPPSPVHDRASAPPPPPPDQEIAKQIDFLGFTVDETLSVWQVQYARTHVVAATRVRDTFTLIRLVDANTRAIMGSFRATGVRRKRIAGPSRRYARAAVETDNPEWLAAQPRSGWKKFRRRIKLIREPVRMDDSALRLYTDDDTDPQLQASPEAISALSIAGDALGYTPIARLMDGSFIALGHYRVEGIPGVVLSSTIEAFRSRSARHLAIVCRFFREDRPNLEIHMATVTSTGKEPYATNTVGVVDMLKIETRQGGEIFKEQFPDLKNMYDFYIGRTWFESR